MASTTRESLGGIPCLCCGREVPVKRSEKGALSVSCSWCDLSAYAKPSTESYRRIMAALPKTVQATVTPIAPPADVAPQPPKFKPAFA